MSFFKSSFLAGDTNPPVFLVRALNLTTYGWVLTERSKRGEEINLRAHEDATQEDPTAVDQVATVVTSFVTISYSLTAWTTSNRVTVQGGVMKMSSVLDSFTHCS